MSRNYNKNFFKCWSRESAYVLGFLFADGNIIRTNRGTHFVAFHTKDRALLEVIRTTIGSTHKLSVRSARSGSVFRLQIGSKIWFDDLCRLGLTPGKVHRMHLPVVPKNYQADFIRGYFDGDGNVWSGHGNRQRERPTHVLQVAFTSASHEFLTSLHLLLRSKGISGGSIFQSKTKSYSRLSFSNSDALKIYKIMYNAPHKLHLLRKRKVFESFVRSQK